LSYSISGKRVLVTGAAGFIGSHLVERLLSEAGQVRAFVRYNSRGDIGLLRYLGREKLSDVEIIFGDLRDFNALLNSLRGVDVLFHLGAMISIPYSYLHPYEVIETNVLGTTNVLLAAREAQVERIVHTSTSEVYGTADYVPIDESHPLKGQSPYSASKIGADKIAGSFYRAYNLPVATIRPFNTFGPRQSMRAVIPTIITQVLTRNELQLGNLDATRDFTFVLDSCEGFVQIASCDACIGDETNIGSGFEVSVRDVAKKVMKIVGREVPIVVDRERIRPEKSEVERLFAGTEKAKRFFGWKPKHSFEEGLRLTIDWIKKNIDIYNPDKYYI